MSILTLGTDLEVLADDLASQLRKPSVDFFLPITIVTPHRYLARWLRLKLARDLGAAINLRVEFLLESVMWELLAALDPREPSPRQLSGEDYRLMILAALLDQAGDRALQDLHDYTGRRETGASRTFWRRSWQLAGRLAGLMRDYEYHRQDQLLAPWRAGHAAILDESQSIQQREASQRAIFTRLVCPGGLIECFGNQAERPCRTLPQYAVEVMELPTAKLRKPERRTAYFFGLSQISRMHVRTLHWLGRFYDLHFYHQNPLLGGLAKLPANPAQAAKRLSQLAEETRKAVRGPAPESPGAELLARWGRSDAESLGLLAGLLAEPAPFAVALQATLPHSEPRVLRRLQCALLGQPHADRVPQDQSLQVAACPGVIREVETVHNSILHNLKTNSTLRLTDIAVLVPDMATYRPAIQAVFDRPPRPVPYNLADYSAAELSLFGRAVVDLLDLALESFTRSRVFAVLLNPCCLARLGVDREQALTWLKWTEKLGIFHGWSAQDKAERGYAVSTLYTWQLGLRRLRLGRLMDPGDDRGDNLAPRFGDVIPFADLASGDKDQLDAFTHAIDGLLPRLVELRSMQATGEKWAAKLRGLLDDFLAVPDDRPEEEHVRNALFQSLDKLAKLDGLRGANKDLPLALLREFVRENLDTLKAMSGEYLIGGVTIAAPQPLLPVPFRIIYFLGLGEGQFPGSDAFSPLDLRDQKRLPGDIRPTESNRGLLLHALLAARDKVYLTYDCRDLQKDQEKHPCGPLNQLRRHLEEHFLAQRELTVAKVPLSSSDPRLLDPSKAQGVTDVEVCYTEPERLLALHRGLAGRTLPLKPEQEAVVKKRLANLPPKFAAASAVEVGGVHARQNLPVVVTLHELAGFLRSPAEAVLKRHLHLSKEDESEPRDDEPFTMGFPQDHNLLRTALRRFLDRALRISADRAYQTWRQDFRDLYAEWQLRGLAPEGAFGELDVKQVQEKIAPQIDGLMSFLKVRPKENLIGAVLLGEHFCPIGAGQRFPYLPFSIDKSGSLATEVRLVGKLPHTWRGDAAVDVLILSTAASKKVAPTQLSAPLLEPALFYMAMKAHSGAGADQPAEWLGQRDFCVHVAHSEGVTPYVYGPDDFTSEQARNYLVELTRDFLDPSQFDELPFDLVREEDVLRQPYEVLESGMMPTSAGYQALFQELLEDDQEGLQPSYRPGKTQRIISLAVPPDALEKVRRRFQPLDIAPARNREQLPAASQSESAAEADSAVPRVKPALSTSKTRRPAKKRMPRERS